MKKSMLMQLRIERARNRLYTLTNQYGNFQHPAVIKQSMVLDELINQYNVIGEQLKKPIG
ncbi:aspartyl-phosphate phosphatase Spo0E family protein [Paenibacillus tritici]|uniref:Aspartyl-phosphate phosphatase Spo0E family protein n=1 Tax=Paenibacillus tritici TaxID=1873425 RepID=A0ABX2DYE8_9BACL|nr:aspartyl-phosphate phosphatase Spo0E family protein [Paenibacillus tritici]NQX49767.1 aspartyl-phosphate phosphatase Spo0E family protein [Paenibacillus tritici]QUL55139.1 aspartyl-phosphate phosphatase Spo0E family protein [Paenibacillus tritici]